MDDIVFAGNTVSDFSYVCRTYCSCDICWFIGRAFSNGNAVARTDVAIWREIIVRKYLLFFNERVVW